MSLIRGHLNLNSLISSEIYFYCTVVAVPIGLFLNLIQFILYSHKEFEKVNIGFLMKILSVVDSLALFWNIVVFRYLNLIGFDLSILSNFSCAIFFFVARTFQEIPLFFQAFIAFINYLSVSYPSKYLFFTRKVIIRCFILIFLAVGIINVPNTYRILAQNDNQTVSCDISHQMNIISTINFALARSIIPIILIICLNCLSVRSLIKSRNRVQLSIEKELKIAKTLVILGFVFLLFNLPVSTLEIMLIVYQYEFGYSTESETFKQVAFVDDCVRAWAYIYYGIGFFISYFSNTIFRKSASDFIQSIQSKLNHLNLKKMNNSYFA